MIRVAVATVTILLAGYTQAGEPALASDQNAYAHLQTLAWLVGSWEEQNAPVQFKMKCEWTKNKNFLTRTFVVKTKRQIELEGTQVIGWDPIRKQIRSWVFDSAGGFGEGTWEQHDNHWTIRAWFVLQDGARASSINILTPVSDKSCTWQSVGRQVDGQIMPNIGPVTLVRQ